MKNLTRTVRRLEKSLRHAKAQLSEQCSQYRVQVTNRGAGQKKLDDYIQKQPQEFLSLNTLRIIALLLLGWGLTTATYLLDYTLFNDAAEYFSADFDDYAKWGIPALLLVFELGLIYHHDRMSEDYDSTGYPPRNYRLVGLLKWGLPILFLSIGLFARWQLISESNLETEVPMYADMLQLAGFTVLLILGHVTIILAGRSVWLGIALPFHWIMLSFLHSQIRSEGQSIARIGSKIDRDFDDFAREHDNYTRLYNRLSSQASEQQQSV